MSNPIVGIGKISEKVMDVAGEMHFWHRFYRQDQIRLFELSYKRLADTYGTMAWGHMAGMAGGGLQMGGAVFASQNWQSAFTGASTLGTQGASLFNQFQQKDQSLANMEVTIYSKKLEESGKFADQDMQTLQKIQSMANSITESLGRVFTRSVSVA
ncbi:MAG: hypothetical protein Tsb0015_11350 [Simkaniaceae bacterium]